MTAVADTRFLLIHTFPTDEKERSSVRELMHSSLRQGLVIPSVALSEYFKTAGKRIGKDGVSTQISVLKENGAVISAIDEDIAILAGEMLLKDEKRSIGDSLIAATALKLRASHVVTDDQHFQRFGLKIRWI